MRKTSKTFPSMALGHWPVDWRTGIRPGLSRAVFQL